MTTTADHVGTGINPPEQRTIEFVGVDAVVSPIGSTHIQVGVILCAATFDDDFHLAVTIQVGHLTVVGYVGIGDIVAIVIINFGKRDVEVARLTCGILLVFIAIPYIHSLALALLHSTHHSTHGISVGGQAVGIGEVRHTQRLTVEFDAVTIDVVLGVVILLGKNTPAEIHTVIDLGGHKTTTQSVCGTLGLSHHTQKKRQEDTQACPFGKKTCHC